jgi:hypothetical protein
MKSLNQSKIDWCDDLDYDYPIFPEEDDWKPEEPK